MLIEKNEDIDITNDLKHKRQLAEYYLLRYDEELELYKERKKSSLAATSPQVDKNIGGGKSNLPGKPTEAKALQSVSYDEKQDAYY